jgi:hypothetical protein
MLAIKKHEVNYSMRECVKRDGKTTFMMTSQTSINRSEFFRATRNKRQEATIIILLTCQYTIFC